MDLSNWALDAFLSNDLVLKLVTNNTPAKRKNIVDINIDTNTGKEIIKTPTAKKNNERFKRLTQEELGILLERLLEEKITFLNIE